MARPESPIDPQAPYAALAHQLRKLRNGAGSPAYKAMARKTGYSIATLSQAASGRKLPSLKVTLAYAAACDGSKQHWREQWMIARQIEAPRLARGDTWSPRPPLPSAAANVIDFVNCLRALKVWAGDPSYGMLARRSPSRMWSKSTLASALAPSRTRLPNLRLVLAIVEGFLSFGSQRYLGDEAYLREWELAWARLATAERTVAQPATRAPNSIPGEAGAHGTSAPTAFPQSPDHTPLRPLDHDLPQAKQELATALRELFSTMQISTRRYATQRHLSASVLSRYLSGERVPPAQFIEDLITDVGETGGRPSSETASHIRQMHREALKSANPMVYKVTALEEEVSSLQTQLTAAREELNALRATA